MEKVVTYRHSRIFNAPIKYVYEWCTDYREDDPKIVGMKGYKYRRIILQKTSKQVVYASNKMGQDGKPKLAVRIVTLHPSTYSWHLDYFGEEDLEVGEYRLRSLGKNKTKLDMVFKNNWKRGRGPSREDFEKGTIESWKKYAKALEADYASA